MEHTQQPKKSIMKRVVYTLIILVILVLLAIVATKFVQNARGGMSAVLASFGIDGGETIVVTTNPSTLALSTTTNEIAVSWRHTKKDRDGSYTFSYLCDDGLVFEYSSDIQNEFVFCNTPFAVSENEFTLIPAFNGTIAETTLTIAFTQNNVENPSLEGTTDVRIIRDTENSANTEDTDTATTTEDTTVTPNPTPTPGPRTTTVINTGTTTTRFSNPNGLADLSVRIIAIGSVNTQGVFTPKNALDRDDNRSAVQFEVINLGTKESGLWQFSAALPTTPSYTYKSDNQETLYPNEKIEFTLGFDKVRNRDTDKIEIVADFRERITELNENNNKVIRTVEIDD